MKKFLTLFVTIFNNLTFKLELVRTVFKGYEVILQDIDEEHEKHVVFPDIKENDLLQISKLYYQFWGEVSDVNKMKEQLQNMRHM